VRKGERGSGERGGGTVGGCKTVILESTRESEGGEERSKKSAVRGKRVEMRKLVHLENARGGAEFDERAARRGLKDRVKGRGRKLGANRGRGKNRGRWKEV